jgi:hypothetical protein
MPFYLLPCPCGRNVTVEPRQAGGEVPCPCGRRLDVPRMREMRLLECVENLPETAIEQRPAAWGAAQRLKLIGVVVLGIALVAVVAIHRTRPMSPDEAMARYLDESRVRDFTPLQTLDYWKWLRRGLPSQTRAQEQLYAQAMILYRAWLTLAGLLGGAGAVLLGAGMWKGHRQGTGKRLQGTGNREQMGAGGLGEQSPGGQT